MRYRWFFAKAQRLTLGVALGTALMLVALACAPATQPTVAPEATAAPQATAAPEATAAPRALEISKAGKYVERAGLRIFIPEGFEFGGPIVPPDPRPPRYGGIPVAVHPGDPPSLDPYHTTSYLMDLTAATTYDRLVGFAEKAGVDPFNNPMIPQLAESWNIADDGLTYTFHLRKGVKFHNLPPVNGREMDAEDVKATLDWYKDTGSIIKSSFENVDRVEVVDKYTVALHLKGVDPQMLLTLAESVRGSIMPREVMNEASNQLRRAGGIGTGPFMVDKPYEFKVGITYRRNPDFWAFEEGNRLPYLDGRKIVVIPDNSASLTAFRTGKVDYGASVPGGVVGLRTFMKGNPTTLVQEYVTIAPDSGSCFCMRLDKAPWSDVRVRRAMSMALDYETIGQALNGQPALLMAGVISGAWYGSDDRLTTVTKECACPWYTYDPQKAKALLAEAGFPKGFSTTLEFFPYSQSSIEGAELYASYWKAIGVDAQIKSMDYTIFRPNVDRGGWENLSHSFLCCGSRTIYSSMFALTPGGPKNSQMGFINDPKLTALASQITASYKDEAAQRVLLGQANAYYRDQVFGIPFVTGSVKSAFSPRLRNFQTNNKIPYVHYFRGWMWTWIDDGWSFAK